MVIPQPFIQQTGDQSLVDLWTFQSAAVREILASEPVYYGDWARVSNAAYISCYRWMVEQMRIRGIECGEYPPVWAWLACGPDAGPPDMQTATSLLSDAELQAGVCRLHLKVPRRLVLPSSYCRWNQALDRSVLHGKPPGKAFQGMFAGPKVAGDDVQCTVPYLRAEWLVEAAMLDSSGGA